MTEVDRIRVALDAARDRYRRLVACRFNGAVTASEVAEAKREVDALRAALEAAEADQTAAALEAK